MPSIDHTIYAHPSPPLTPAYSTHVTWPSSPNDTTYHTQGTRYRDEHWNPAHNHCDRNGTLALPTDARPLLPSILFSASARQPGSQACEPQSVHACARAAAPQRCCCSARQSPLRASPAKSACALAPPTRLHRRSECKSPKQ